MIGQTSTKAKVDPELVVLYEHPQWQRPLFEALERRGVSFAAFDLKSGVFSDRDVPDGRLYFNQASPSAYLRGNTRAVPFALALIEDLESRGRRVLNGSKAFRIELSKITQVGLMRRLNIPYPRTWAFNQVHALKSRADELVFPAVVKPNQGGSGARMVRVDSLEELLDFLEQNPDWWLPDNLLLLQEFLSHDSEGQGIVRMEFLGGELLYAMRIVSKGNFNLCPSEVCNPVRTEDTLNETACEPHGSTSPGSAAPEFYPYPDVPESAVHMGKRLFKASGLDVGAVEYLETTHGRRVFYDLNANSNLRRPIGEFFGFDPFERLVDFLVAQLELVSA